MAFSLRKFIKGIIIDAVSPSSIHSQEGALYVSSSNNDLRIYLDSAHRIIVTHDQAQTLENKTISADVNTISELEVDNLKSGVLNTSTTMAGASNTNIPSSLAIKTYVDDSVTGKDDASEINYSNTTSGLTATDVQAAIDEVEGRLDTVEGDTGLADHLADATDAHDGSAISYVNTTSGLTATNVQAAIDEVEGRVDTAETGLSDHLADASDAHDASAISYVNTTSGLTATDTQAAIDEVEGRVDTLESASHVNTFEGRSGAVVSQSGDYDASEIDYTPGTLSDWNSSVDPGQTDDAIDQLASRTKLLEDAPGGPGGRVANYLANLAGGYDAEENDVSDWTESANGRFDISVESTSPLRGTYSYKLTATSALAGDYIETPAFTLDTSDFTSIMTFIMDMSQDSNYSDGDIKVEFVQGSNVIASLSDLGDIKAGRQKLIAQFQSLDSSEGTSCKIRFTVVNAGTYSIIVDHLEFKNNDQYHNSVSQSSFRVNLSAAAAGAYTSTTSATIPYDNVVHNTSGYFSVSGGVITYNGPSGYFFAHAQILSNGNVGAGNFTFIELRKNNSQSDDSTILGLLEYNAANTAILAQPKCSGVMYLETGDTVRLISNSSGYSHTLYSSTAVEQYSNLSLTSLDNFGASSLGSDILASVEYKGNGGTTITANVTNVDWNTKEIDNLGTWDGTQYTAKVDQEVDVSGIINLSASSAIGINFYVDGSFTKAVANRSSSDTKHGFFGTQKLLAGEKLSIRLDSSVTLSNNAVVHRINLKQRPTTSNGVTPEQVKFYAAYSSNAGQSANSGTSLIWEDETSSTHPWYDTSTGDLTPDRSCRLQIEINGFVGAVSHASQDYFLIRLRRNGSNETIMCTTVGQNAGTYGLPFHGSLTIDVDSGDVIDFITEENSASSYSLSTDSQINYIIFTEVR